MTFSGHRLLKGFLNALSQRSDPPKDGLKPGLRPFPDREPIDNGGCRSPEKICPSPAINRCFNPAEGGSHSRFTFGVAGFTGFYDEIRQRTKVEGVLLNVFGGQYGADTQGAPGPCADCPYPGHYIRFSLRSKKSGYNLDGAIAPGGIELHRGGQKHLILIPPSNPLYIKGGGCLGNECSENFDAELHLSYSDSDNPGNHRNAPAVCDVDFDLISKDDSYVFGQSPPHPQLQGKNIAIFDHQLCQTEGCSAAVISQEIGALPTVQNSRASIAMGFNAWSKDECPC